MTGTPGPRPRLNSRGSARRTSPPSTATTRTTPRCSAWMNSTGCPSIRAGRRASAPRRSSRPSAARSASSTPLASPTLSALTMACSRSRRGCPRRRRALAVGGQRVGEELCQPPGPDFPGGARDDRRQPRGSRALPQQAVEDRRHPGRARCAVPGGGRGRPDPDRRRRRSCDPPAGGLPGPAGSRRCPAHARAGRGSRRARRRGGPGHAEHQARHAAARRAAARRAGAARPAGRPGRHPRDPRR